MDDLSALIFVALAVAWAVYLIPKALQHHEDAQRSRSIDKFSHTMRVLARREPVAGRGAGRGSRLVVSPGRAPSPPVVTAKPTSTRAAALPGARRSAARRRRRVLGTITVGLLATIGVAAFGLISWWYVALPGALLAAWLVACRLMVRGEELAKFDAWLHEAATGETPVVKVDLPPMGGDDPLEDTTSTPAVTDPSLWDPMPMTLPTYVSKPAAERSVRTIDLDSTGVWTSGRTEGDAAIARQAEADAQALKDARVERERRATGS